MATARPNDNNVLDENALNKEKDDMMEVFCMMSKLDLGIYSEIVSNHSEADKKTLRNYLVNQLMKDLTKMGYSKEQQQKANIPAVVDLISSYICSN